MHNEGKLHLFNCLFIYSMRFILRIFISSKEWNPHSQHHLDRIFYIRAFPLFPWWTTSDLFPEQDRILDLRDCTSLEGQRLCPLSIRFFYVCGARHSMFWKCDKSCRGQRYNQMNFWWHSDISKHQSHRWNWWALSAKEKRIAWVKAHFMLSS